MVGGNESSMRKVLNVGGNSKDIAIPACFNGWRHDLLDIDSRGKPDICCDARELWKMPPRQYDAIYCSHNLEHYHRHDVLKVLKSFKIILKKDGFALIRVPDLHSVLNRMISGGLDIDDVLYVVPCGPILVRDVIYGWHVEIERSGNDFFAHKTGFTKKSLETVLAQGGFPFSLVSVNSDTYEITALAFMQQPDDERVRSLVASLT